MGTQLPARRSEGGGGRGRGGGSRQVEDMEGIYRSDAGCTRAASRCVQSFKI